MITFSELASFIDCGMAYRLRNLIGFQPRLAPELGYGKAVHHVLRSIAETTRDTGHVPTPAEIDDILDSSFFLPTANKVAHRQLKDAARRLITTYATKHEADLHRIWETERPFELHLDGVTISGRADVILDHEGGVPTALALVDYKTSVRGTALDHALQLQVYANAGLREGLDVRAAFVHDLKKAARDPVGVGCRRHPGCRGDRHHRGCPYPRPRLRPEPGAWLPRLRGSLRLQARAAVSAGRSDVEDLQHLVAVVVDHLDGDPA